MLLKGLYYGEEFPLSSRIPSLGIVQLPAVERYRFSVLGYHCSQLVMASIRMDDEWLAVIRVGQHHFSRDDPFGEGESSLLLRSPFPLGLLRGEGS